MIAHLSSLRFRLTYTSINLYDIKRTWFSGRASNEVSEWFKTLRRTCSARTWYPINRNSSKQHHKTNIVILLEISILESIRIVSFSFCRKIDPPKRSRNIIVLRIFLYCGDYLMFSWQMEQLDLTWVPKGEFLQLKGIKKVGTEREEKLFPEKAHY